MKSSGEFSCNFNTYWILGFNNEAYSGNVSHLQTLATLMLSVNNVWV